MKKLVLSLGLLGFMTSSLWAGTVDITSATDSLFNPCQVPNNVMFVVQGTTSGYSVGDSLEISAAFGDGTDTTFKMSLWNTTTFGVGFDHNYTMPGLYTVQYVATGPDGASDTLVVPNEVVLGTTCDNVTGRVYVDHNTDCSYDPQQDEALAGRLIRLKLAGQVVLQTITGQDGEYSFSAVAGQTYDVELENQPLGFVCPTGGSHTVSSLPAANLDFALDCSGSQFDLESRYTGGFVVPGVSRPLHFQVRNNFCTPTSGVAKVVLNSGVQYDPSAGSATVPDNIVGDTLFFNFSQMSIGNNLSINIYVTGDTTLTVNDTVCLSVIATPDSGDADVSNNALHPCIEVRTSYDPNMKTVYPAGEGADGFIRPDQKMMYTVHFQNTGNFMATNVFILDTIDTQTLDINSLEILEYSHPMELKMLDNDVLRFNFNNIMLPDSNSNEPASHGYVTFAIDQEPGLANATTIENKAGIYFDYNPPIITNTAVNTIDVTISIEEVVDAVQPSLFEAYPNPSSGAIWVELNEGIGNASLEIYDLNGKMLLQEEMNTRKHLNLNSFPRGIYILRVSSDAAAEQKRIIVE